MELKGFSKLSYAERLNKLLALGILSPKEIEFLIQGGLQDVGLGEKLIENVIGYFQLPLGVATNFRIDNKDYIIPMAVEETSIVAAASKTAKWVRENGTIVTAVVGTDIVGQIQLAKVVDFERFYKLVTSKKHEFIQSANSEVAFGLVRRGGGVTGLEIRRILRPDGQDMAVLHIYMNPVDAMGANIINQV